MIKLVYCIHSLYLLDAPHGADPFFFKDFDLLSTGKGALSTDNFPPALLATPANVSSFCMLIIFVILVSSTADCFRRARLIGFSNFPAATYTSSCALDCPRVLSTKNRNTVISSKQPYLSSSLYPLSHVYSLHSFFHHLISFFLDFSACSYQPTMSACVEYHARCYTMLQNVSCHTEIYV